MKERLELQGLEYKAPLIPASLQAIVDKQDPVSCAFGAEGAENPYWGKKILCLYGHKDDSSFFSFSFSFSFSLLPYGLGTDVFVSQRLCFPLVVPFVPHSSAFLEKLNVGPDGRKKSVGYDVGHELTEEGIKLSTEWIRVYGLLGAETKEE